MIMILLLSVYAVLDDRRMPPRIGMVSKFNRQQTHEQYYRQIVPIYVAPLLALYTTMEINITYTHDTSIFPWSNADSLGDLPRQPM